MTIHQALLASSLFALVAATETQAADPLPDRLVGTYHSAVGRKGTVVPLELSSIKVDGENVTGVVSNYRTVDGMCLADNTPLTGTYKDGVLSIKSSPMVSQRPDGAKCGGMVLNAKVSGGHASGTFGLGKDSGILVELDAK
jgi:hypothetical protein